MLNQRTNEELLLNIKTEYCQSPFSCEMIGSSLLYQCPFNSFCNSIGKCQNFKDDEIYSKPCTVDYSFKLSKYEYCNGKGLSCINKKCRICNEGEIISGLDIDTVYELSLYALYDRKAFILIHSSCINQEWSNSTWNVKNNVSTILFLIFCILSGVFLFLIYLENVKNFLLNFFDF